VSGHSKWHSIKHKKAAADAKRGRVFTKVIKEITVAARLGGGDFESNARLRLAVDKAKQANMPADNIKRAIQKGTGELPGVSYEEVTYEGYGPGGAAVMVEVFTDNKNRTVADLRHIFSRHGGNFGAANCVVWKFERKGIITLEGDPGEEVIMEIALEAGALDISKDDEGFWQITTAPDGLYQVKQSMESQKFIISNAEIVLVPSTTTPLEGKQAEQMLKLMERLEEHDDVQNVYADFDIPEEIMDTME